MDEAGRHGWRLQRLRLLALCAMGARRLNAPLVERKAKLRECFRLASEDALDWRSRSFGADDGVRAVQIGEDGWAFYAQDVLSEAQRVWSAGGEGSMVKDAQAPYRRNRNAAWLKVKQENAHRWMRWAA